MGKTKEKENESFRHEDEDDESDDEPHARLSARDRDLQIKLKSPTDAAMQACVVASGSRGGIVSPGRMSDRQKDTPSTPSPILRASQRGSIPEGPDGQAVVSDRKTSISQPNQVKKAVPSDRKSNGKGKGKQNGEIIRSARRGFSREHPQIEEKSAAKDTASNVKEPAGNCMEVIDDVQTLPLSDKSTSKRKIHSQEEDGEYVPRSRNSSSDSDSNLFPTSEDEPVPEHADRLHMPGRPKERRKHRKTTPTIVSEIAQSTESIEAIGALLVNEKRSRERLQRKSRLIFSLQGQLHKQQETLRGEVTEIKYLEARLRAQALSIRELRAALLRSELANRPSSSNSLALSHIRMRNSLTLLFTRLEAWASNHALPQPLPALTIHRVKMSLSQCDTTISGFGMENWTRFDLSSPECRPSMILSGLLASKIIKELFGQAGSPWFLWKAKKIGFPDNDLHATPNAPLNMVLGEVGTCFAGELGESKGVKWRAEMIQHLLEPEGGSTKSVRGSGFALEGHKRVVIDFVEDLLQSVPVQYLRQDVDTIGHASMEEFVAITGEFVGLAARVWSMPAKIEVLGMDQILDWHLDEVDTPGIWKKHVIDKEDILDITEELGFSSNPNYQKRRAVLVFRPGIVVQNVPSSGPPEPDSRKIWSKMSVYALAADEHPADEAQSQIQKAGTTGETEGGGELLPVKTCRKSDKCQCGGMHDSSFWRFRFGVGRPLSRVF